MGRGETWRTGEARLEEAASRCRPVGCDRRPGLTEASVDDATTGITLIEAVDGALGRVTAGCRLRYDRLLRGRRCAWGDRRGSADEYGQRVSTRTAVERS